VNWDLLPLPLLYLSAFFEKHHRREVENRWYFGTGGRVIGGQNLYCPGYPEDHHLINGGISG